MQQQFGKPVISFIQNHTAYYYLFARAEYKTNPQKFDNDYQDFYKKRSDTINALAAQDSLLGKGKSIWQYLDNRYKANIAYNVKENPASVAKEMIYNIIENSTTGSNFTSSLKSGNGDNTFEQKKKFFNTTTRYENILMTLLLFVNWLGLLIVAFKTKFSFKTEFTSVIIIQLFCSYYLITSGISFWQGDRFNYIFAPLTLIVTAYLYQTLSPTRNLLQKRAGMKLLALPLRRTDHAKPDKGFK